jgi:predicted TIM-barrel fold metal-dependent hydrolase
LLKKSSWQGGDVINRRQWIYSAGLASVGIAAAPAIGAASAEPQSPEASDGNLALKDYKPKSMLQVHESQVDRARFPVIDIHTHLTGSVKYDKGVAVASEREYLATPQELLQVMEAKNIRTLVNLTGGYGKGLNDAVARYDKAHPGRFISFCEPIYEKFLDPSYPKLQAETIEQSHNSGARGLKILKTLGLYLRENITTGKLVTIDDRRFDPMWDACAQYNMPVAIHISDPAAFFTPTDQYNERYEELHNHPDWSFHGGDFPTNEELIAARNRVITRHPKTQFIVLHVGSFAENLANVSENLDRFPNMTVELGARIGELGRQPRTARRFFDKYQDRILFGTDATPHGDAFPQQLFGNKLYEIYWRFLETEDEYFDYAPAEVPPQGRWRIYGIGLPETILRKVYYNNAARLLKLSPLTT